MDASTYERLLDELGFDPVERRKTLKHPQLTIPSLYFNVKRDGTVYFTGLTAQKSFYSPQMWTAIGPQQVKDDKPNLFTVVPKPGYEKQALARLLASGCP